MKDKPYTERLGGSYVRDAVTGEVKPADQVKPVDTATAPAPAAETKKVK